MMLIVYGNIVDGFQFIGPFEDADEAAAFADMNCEGGDGWSLVPILAPEKFIDPSFDDTAVNAANTLDRQGLIDAANETKRLNDNLDDMFPTND